jgi:hypothetical protein
VVHTSLSIIYDNYTSSTHILSTIAIFGLVYNERIYGNGGN